MRTNTDPCRKLENDEADSPSCAICREIITESPHIEGGRLACIDGNPNICRTCCQDVECRQTRREHAEDAKIDFAKTQAAAFGMMARAAIETSATWSRLGYPESAELSRLKASGFAEAAWRYAREATGGST